MEHTERPRSYGAKTAVLSPQDRGPLIFPTREKKYYDASLGALRRVVIGGRTHPSSPGLHDIHYGTSHDKILRNV